MKYGLKLFFLVSFLLHSTSLFADSINRLIESISFENNKVINSRTLMTGISIRSGDIYSKEKLLKTLHEIQDLYAQEGFYNVKINTELKKGTAESSSDNKVLIIFNLQENQASKIQRVEFESKNEKIKSLLTKQTQQYIGKTLSSENLTLLKDSIQQALILNRYLKASFEQKISRFDESTGMATLFFEVSDSQKYEILIQGNKLIDDLYLYRKLKLSEYARSDTDPAIVITESLKKIYLSKGFANVSVTFTEKFFKDSDIIRVIIHITEGEIVQIGRLTIKGRFSKKASYYSSFILNNSSDVIAGGLLNREDLEVGYKNLITELNNQGYLQAKINSSRIEFLSNKTHAYIEVVIDEGPLTQIKKISFEGNKSFDTSQLLEVIELKTNDSLSLKQLEESIKKLQRFYFERGYLEMKILSNNTEIVKYNASGTHAFIQLNIQEGPKIYIKDIVLKGNQFTKDYVLLIEADLEIGELITPKLLSETTNRLNRLGLFSRVDITTLEANTSVEGRTLVISVIEDEPGTFRFGLGASSEKELTLRGFTGISFNNLDGTGRGISLRAELKNHIRTENEFSYKVTLGYLEPFLFNSRTRGRVNLTRLKDVGVIDTSGLPITESNRLDFLLERDLTNDLTLTYTLWSLDSAKKYLTRDDPDTGEDVKDIVVIGPTFTYEKRNSLTNPTRGYLARWSLKYSNPNLGSSDLIHFYQTEASFVHLTPLSKTERWVWSNSIRGGYVENLSDKAGSGVPDSYAFFLGGFSTVRGFDSFESDERIPPKYELPTSSNNQLIISTNSNYHLFKSEVRFPLYNKWGGVLFYDAGTVIIAGSDQRKPFRQSAGFGLYYDTPFGPVNLQVGYKLDRQEPFIVDGRRVDESPYKFHFSIGVF